MSRLPSPFQQDLPTILTSPSVSASPGFLMMTRPPNATSEGMGKNNRRGYHHPRGQSSYPNNPRGQNHYSNNPQGQSPYSNNPRGQSPYSNNPRGQSPYSNNPRGQSPYSNNSLNNFVPFRNPNYNHNRTPQFVGKQKSLPSPSPNRNFSNMRSFSGPHTYPNSPNFNYSHNRGEPRNRGSFSNVKKGKHDTPLKSIPVDKFVSTNMMYDPWMAFASDGINFTPKSDSTRSRDVDFSIDDDGASTNESLSTTETTDSPSGFGTLSEGDTETESDAASDN